MSPGDAEDLPIDEEVIFITDEPVASPTEDMTPQPSSAPSSTVVEDVNVEDGPTTPGKDGEQVCECWYYVQDIWTTEIS